MTTATQSDKSVVLAKAGTQKMDSRVRGNDDPAKPLAKKLRNALFAEWPKVSPTIEWECSEREARIRFANEVLRRGGAHPALPGAQQAAPLQSWSELTQGEAKRLLREMKERSGSNAAYRALLIGKIALRLFGSGWEPIVMERCRQRFLMPDTRNLTPDQAHSLMEELLSRIAREEGREIEELRREIRGARPAQGAASGAPTSERTA